MKVFVSSLISGYEQLRDAAASGAATLGHLVVRAETLGASPTSPQAACLAEVRDADIIVLILGARYGSQQSSELSATHEEYREARDAKPVIVMIQSPVDPEPEQAAFIREVQGWERGHFTAAFRDPDELRDKVIRALYDYALATEAGPLDETDLLARAQQLVPPPRNVSGADLVVGITCGPRRSVLRPSELEDPELHRRLQAEALTGDDAVLSTSRGTDLSIRGSSILFVQDQGIATVALDEEGSVLIVQPAVERDAWRTTGIPSIIEEAIHERIIRTIRFSGRVLDHIDGAQRLTHVVVVVALRGTGHMPWRTRAEQTRSPDRATMNMRSVEQIVVTLSPPVRRRAALLHDTQRMAEDFVARLRREARG